MAEYYSIRSLQEAVEYLKDPILGKRLMEISEALLELDTNDASAVFGWPDDLKLRSSMTLFAEADPDQQVLQKVLDKFFNGEKDRLTLEKLGRE